MCFYSFGFEGAVDGYLLLDQDVCPSSSLTR